MLHDSGSKEAPVALSAAAWSEWNHVVEQVMHGVAHALNNRAAALSAVIDLSKDGDELEGTGGILAQELQRVRDLSFVIRSMGPPRAGVEAFAPRDAATDALAVIAMHAGQRERVAKIDANTGAAVRAPKWMFVRALVALVVSVPVSGVATHGVRVVVAEDGDWVVTRVDGFRAQLGAQSRYTEEMAQAMGGDPLDGALGFRLPSLTALRRREGRTDRR